MTRNKYLSAEWCYSRYNAIKQRLANDASYADCSMCEEWETFSTFKQWIIENSVQGWDIDKDLRIEGSKIYSPQTCIFVPTTLNKAFKGDYAKKKGYPKGVRIQKSGRYQSIMYRNGKGINLGTFNTIDKASLVFQKALILHRYKVVNTYQDDPRLAALIDVLKKRLKNQAEKLKPLLRANNL